MENEHEHPHVAPLPNGDGPAPVRCVTAFLVLIMPDGSAMGNSDPATPYLADRVANLSDMYTGCATVMKDVEIMQLTQNVVQNVINAQLQVGQQMSQAAQDQQLAKQIMMPNRTQRRH